MEALCQCAPELVSCFYRAICDFPIYPEFFVPPVKHVDTLSLRIYTPADKAMAIAEHEEFIWLKFYEECPIWASELDYAIDTCVTTGVARNTRAKEQLIQQFFMERFRILLMTVPTIHNEHTMKFANQNHKSSGPVPLWDIIHLRQKAGLPILDYLPKNVYHYP